MICKRCAHAPLAVSTIAAPWRYGGPLASAIKRLKFANATYVARSLAPLWSPLIAAAAVDALTVPIPLFWRRRWARGYDHAWLLAVHGCRAAGIAGPQPLLVRRRAAAPQSTLRAVDRLANLGGAFVVRRRWRRAIVGRTIVLLDDVVTTGATMSEAARVLLAAGAATVVGVALARASAAWPG